MHMQMHTHMHMCMYMCKHTPCPHHAHTMPTPCPHHAYTHLEERLHGCPALLLRAHAERAHLAPMLEALDEEDQAEAIYLVWLSSTLAVVTMATLTVARRGGSGGGCMY